VIFQGQGGEISAPGFFGAAESVQKNDCGSLAGFDVVNVLAVNGGGFLWRRAATHLPEGNRTEGDDQYYGVKSAEGAICSSRKLHGSFSFLRKKQRAIQKQRTPRKHLHQL